MSYIAYALVSHYLSPLLPLQSPLRQTCDEFQQSIQPTCSSSCNKPLTGEPYYTTVLRSLPPDLSSSFYKLNNSLLFGRALTGSTSE